MLKLMKMHTLLNDKSSVLTFLQFSIYTKAYYSLVISFLLNKYTLLLIHEIKFGRLLKNYFQNEFSQFFFFIDIGEIMCFYSV